MKWAQKVPICAFVLVEIKSDTLHKTRTVGHAMAFCCLFYVCWNPRKRVFVFQYVYTLRIELIESFFGDVRMLREYEGKRVFVLTFFFCHKMEFILSLSAAVPRIGARGFRCNRLVLASRVRTGRFFAENGPFSPSLTFRRDYDQLPLGVNDWGR